MQDMTTEVLASERRLQAAQAAGDVAALDTLLHDDLLAVGPNGTFTDKAGDLAVYRSGAVEVLQLQEEDARVRVVGETAVTFVVIRLVARAHGAEFSSRMRCTRTWARGVDGWRLLAAHVMPIAD